MKHMVVFCCEFCAAPPFETLGKAQEHEAKHFGLTVEEYQEWGRLEQKVRQASATVSCASNPTTRKAYDDAISDICAFELEHHIPGDAKTPQFFS